MKNKFNRCCCDEVASTECTICTRGRDSVPTCYQYEAIDESITLLVAQHPDTAKDDFVSQGRLLGDVNLGNEEGSVWILFDYLDIGNYYAVKFNQTAYEQEIVLTVLRVTGGAETELGSRVVWVEQDVNLWTGEFCIAWKSGYVNVTVHYPGGAGGSLTVSKLTDNHSGRVGTSIVGLADATIHSYFRGPGEITDQGTCADCLPIEPGQPCTCCPDNVAPTWLVNTSGFALTDGDMLHCDTLNGSVFILDRTSGVCTASYSQIIFNSACFGVFNTRLTIALTIGTTEGTGCYLQVIITLDPVVSVTDPPGPCGFGRILAIYRKNIAVDGINELCSGSHTLTQVYTDIGSGDHCDGVLPNTILVESLV